MTHRHARAIVFVVGVIFILFAVFAIVITDKASRNEAKWQFQTRRGR